MGPHKLNSEQVTVVQNLRIRHYTPVCDLVKIGVYALTKVMVCDAYPGDTAIIALIVYSIYQTVRWNSQCILAFQTFHYIEVNVT